MKLIASTIFGLIALAIIWYYVPEPTKNKVVSFTGKAVKHDPAELTTLAKNEFLPKSPEEKREVLIAELKKNIENIKTGTKLPESISEADKLLAELEAANKEKTVTASVLDRALDLVLPSQEAQCPK